ncbi:Hsp70 family protein-like protein [Xylogone sp. PMI_703]|nr:Hsp70 family protein-like protein [Xylogone sp. PMI_703]
MTKHNHQAQPPFSNMNSPDTGERFKHKIIVGVDYGTTFSGVSYVTTDRSDIDDINIISSWPGELHTAWKAPTKFAYKMENPKIQNDKWGYEVTPKHISYSWTKLLLDKNAAVGEFDDPSLLKIADNGMMRVPKFRNAAGLCQDFLSELYLYVTAKLKQQMTEATFDKTPMECWITLPAIWSDEAKDTTLKAAKNAGFGSRSGDEIFTISEPEAAAITTLRKYSKINSVNPIQPNENILICDCGGGTVDITTYTITQVHPTLTFDELCVGIGGKCGSTYIDRNLHKLLTKRFGSAFKNVPSTQKGPGSAFMRCFEGVKRDFGLFTTSEEKEIYPLRLDIEESKYYDPEESTIKILMSTKKRIILVGGFGESAYLNKALSEWCQLKGDITLMCPENPQAAVVRGAALRGLEGIAPRIKHARRHYGVCLELPFREGIDPEELAHIHNYYDTKYCRNRTQWLISKGEEVFHDTVKTIPCHLIYHPGQEQTGRIKLVSCSLNEPPEYSTDIRVEEVGVIVSRFGENFNYGRKAESKYNHRLNRMVHNFHFDVQAEFGRKGENLTFKNLVDGEVVSTATIEFDRH